MYFLSFVCWIIFSLILKALLFIFSHSYLSIYTCASLILFPILSYLIFLLLLLIFIIPYFAWFRSLRYLHGFSQISLKNVQVHLNSLPFLRQFSYHTSTCALDHLASQNKDYKVMKIRPERIVVMTFFIYKQCNLFESWVVRVGHCISFYTLLKMQLRGGGCCTERRGGGRGSTAWQCGVLGRRPNTEFSWISCTCTYSVHVRCVCILYECIFIWWTSPE